MAERTTEELRIDDRGLWNPRRCPVAHRLPAHRQRQDLHFQLALRPPQPGHHDPAHRRHRRRSQHAGLARFHLRRPEVARSRLGRAVSSVRTRATCIAKWPGRSSKRAWPIAISRRPRPMTESKEHSRRAHGCSIPACASSRAEESERRADAGEPFVLRFRVPRDSSRKRWSFTTRSTASNRSSPADIEDFALLRSNGMPTYHMASCADDIDLTSATSSAARII